MTVTTELQTTFCDCLDAQLLPAVLVDAVLVLRHQQHDKTRERINQALTLVWAKASPLLLLSYDSNTHEEARRFRQMADALGWRRIAIVTHKYHHYRAFLTFLKVFEGTGIEIYSMPLFMPDVYLHDELVKIAQYQQDGHVASYQEGIDQLCRQSSTPSHI